MRLLARIIRAFGAGGAGRRLGTCPGCLTSVYEDDLHAWYRGEVFHVEPCVEISPYATRAQRDRR